MMMRRRNAEAEEMEGEEEKSLTIMMAITKKRARYVMHIQGDGSEGWHKDRNKERCTRYMR